MKTSNTLTIFITPIKGEEICIEKACTLKQAVTLAKKEARKAIHNGGIFVTINIIARVSYGVETLAHIEAEKQGRRVAFSDEQPGENNAIAETPETPNPEPNNTPTTMNANEIVASLNESQIRRACAALLPTKLFDEYFTPERGNIVLLRQMLEDHVFEYDTTSTEIIEAAGADENANETTSAAIIAELNTRKDRSAWDKGVTEYAIELAESLDNWDKQPGSVAELRKMMLNGADDWKAYSWGGSSLIYNQDIAERLCSPSELKRVTNKNGLRDYPNSREYWLDVQARALYQAANRVAEIANKFFNA